MEIRQKMNIKISYIMHVFWTCSAVEHICILYRKYTVYGTYINFIQNICDIYVTYMLNIYVTYIFLT